MGCCASTTNKAASVSRNNRRSLAARSHSSHYSRAPPLPFLEEETVKEVLSETPTPKPSLPKKIEDEEKKINEPKLALHKVQEEDDYNNVDKKPLRVNAEEISEICSLSESVSTTTVTEKREDDDGEVRQRVNRSPAKFRNRSFSGVLSGKGDGAVGKSPVRRSEPAPGRVRPRPRPTKEGRVLKTDRQRMDSGDSFHRRPRSPATCSDTGGKRPGLGRTPSGRRSSGNSPARVRSNIPERTRKMEETKAESKSPPTTNELLENPLVSLECFIFL
ncbi:uncharacterized protein LOC132266311 [Cornus florida]|uniref:uncharacterized protein LOC132266311 n=1 Tax=Cornus florida TaxID=4283 RepID=UPI00289E98A0|nr:uncharacterized protein LOC132266311 [Cornus florida]